MSSLFSKLTAESISPRLNKWRQHVQTSRKHNNKDSDTAKIFMHAQSNIEVDFVGSVRNRDILLDAEFKPAE